MIDSRLNDSLSSSESNESKIPAPLAEQIRRLSHDLSNALEVIMQTNYLLGMSGEMGPEESGQMARDAGSRCDAGHPDQPGTPGLSFVQLTANQPGTWPK